MPALELSSTTLGSDANLISYHKLEDTAPTTGTFTLTNNGTVPFVAGQFNNAARTGTAAGVYLGTGNDLGIAGGSITMMFFTRLFGTPASGGQVFFSSQFDTGVDVNYDLRYENVTNTLTLFFERQRRGVAGDGTGIANDMGTTGSHMVTMTYDATTLRGFVDGTQIGSIAVSGNGASADADDFTIGGGYAGQQPANAWIDDFAVFNRALGTQEILDHWLGNDAIVSAGGNLDLTSKYW